MIGKVESKTRSLDIVHSQRWFYSDDGILLGSYTGPDDSLPALFIGASIGPAPTSPTVADYQVAIQSLVDETAQSIDFRNGESLASYFNSTVPLWASQARAFVAWRDSVWQRAYAELARVQNGQRVQPTVGDFLPELPKIVWPAS